MLAVNLYEFFASNAPEVEAESVPVVVRRSQDGAGHGKKCKGGPYGLLTAQR
jgi:hypothetical protein